MTETAINFLSLLAILCQVFVVVVVGFRIAAWASPALRPSFGRVSDALGDAAAPLAFAVALVTMSGSLYFSEVAHFIPCRLCWIQRSLLYPQVLLCGLLWFRPTWVWIRRLALLLVALDIPVSTYHYVIEWKPSLEGISCGKTSCTLLWFRQFGYVTLPSMALTSACTIGVLLLLARRRVNATRRASDTRSIAG